MSLDSIAEEIGTIEHEQETDEFSRVPTDDGVDVDGSEMNNYEDGWN